MGLPAGGVPAGGIPAAVVAAVCLMLAGGGLVAYKASAALKTLAATQVSGTLAPKVGWLSLIELSPWLRPFAATLNYFWWVIVALTFGVVIGALVRTLVPERWLAQTIAAPGLRGHVVAAMLGAPLMLCSCCVAPIFDGVFARTRRLGPALGLMFAAPALNPAALVLTFLLFPRHLAVGRLVLSLVLVIVGSSVLGRLFGSTKPAIAQCSLESRPFAMGRVLREFLSSLAEVSRRTLPAVLLGVLASAALAQALPVASLADAAIGPFVLLLVAAVAVLIALPTFGEIPIALALHAASVPDAIVLAVLVAGPAVNLPSLLTLRRAVSARAAVATGLAVFLVASIGGSAVAWLA